MAWRGRRISASLVLMSCAPPLAVHDCLCVRQQAGLKLSRQEAAGRVF